MIMVSTQELIEKIENLNSKVNRIDKKVHKLEEKNSMFFTESL